MGVRIGVTPTSTESNNLFWGLKEGDVVEVVILHDVEEIVSAEQIAMWNVKPPLIWTVNEADDPAYELGLKTSYRAFVPVLVKNRESGENELRVWSISKQMHMNLCEIGEAMGGTLVGAVVKAKRTGSGLKTRYSITNTGRTFKNIEEIEIPSSEDIVRMLKLMSREEVIQHIENTTGMTYAEFSKKAKLLEGKGSSVGSSGGEDAPVTSAGKKKVTVDSF